MKWIAEPVHKYFPVKRWYNPKDSSHLERVRKRGLSGCSYEWFLNDVKIDGFTASQLLKDSH